MKAVSVCYDQSFRDVLVEGFDVRYVDNVDQVIEIINSLHDNPHVISVWVEEVE